MPRKALVAPDVSTALLYFEALQLDSEEWGAYGAGGAITGQPFERIVWLVDENSYRDPQRTRKREWVTHLLPNGRLIELAIR